MRVHWYVLCHQSEPVLATRSEAEAASWIVRGREFTVEVKKLASAHGSGNAEKAFCDLPKQSMPELDGKRVVSFTSLG